MLGAIENPGLMSLIVLVSIAFFLPVGWVILKLYRRARESTEAEQLQVYEELALANEPGPGLVSVVFHCYSGFFTMVHQTEHRFWTSPEDARKALWRLHCYNLTRGFFAYWVLIIPLLSYLNYRWQLRSIRKQEAAGGWPSTSPS